MDRLRAKNWYLWLWLSPLLTLPTLAVIWLLKPGYESFSPILGSALWHLILLVPALNTQAPFVRWHGRQALVLAAMRTAIALVFGPILGQWPLAVLVLIAVWFAGTLWGQTQIGRGDCSLMRWAGHEEELSALQRAEHEADTEEPGLERLVEVIRSSGDPQERQKALSELERRGMVELL